MSLSLIVVNHNGGTNVVRNLRSMLDSAGNDAIELVVVDNASTDGSLRAIRRALPEAILVESETNEGYAAGVNLGLDRAEGDVLVVMNPDITPRGDAVAVLAAAATETGCLTGGAVLDRSGRMSPNCFRRAPAPADILREALFVRPRTRLDRDDAFPEGVFRTDVVSGSVMALTRESYERLGPMDERYFLYDEDVEWCARAGTTGIGVAVAAGAAFEHEGGLSTRSNEGPAFAARVLSDFQYFCEGAGAPVRSIRGLWLVRLWLRSWLYRMDASIGAPDRRASSRRRAAIYRLLLAALREFEWWPAADGGRNADPSRLFRFPEQRPPRPGDARPRVLQVVPNMEVGGAQRLVELYVKGPLSERFRFEILCLTHLGQIGERLAEEGCPVHLAGASGWRRPSDWRRVADYACLLECDLVHSHVLPGDVAAWLGFGRRVPRVSTKHSTDEWFGWLPRAVERMALRGAADVLAVSDAAARAKSYLGRQGMLPAVIESPPSVAVADPPAPLLLGDRPAVVSVIGRLHPVKRVDLFIRTAAILERRRPGAFSYVVVGEGREGRRLRELAEELGLGDRIDFRGATLDVELAFDESDIVMMLSDYEGLALTILETLARGRVPVVRLTPGTSEALPSSLGRCLVDSDDPSDFAEKVIEVLDDRAGFERLVRLGAEWVAGREDCHEAIGSVYDEVLGGSGRARVLHLITRLIVGGAQENTIASVAGVDPGRYDSRLWTGEETGSEGSLFADARARGIVVRVMPNMVREISPVKDLVMLFQLTRLLRRGHFDIVHTHASKAGILGRVAARLAGVPHITHTLHGWGFHDRMHPALKHLYAAAERSIAPWTRPLISVSEKTTRVGREERIGEPDQYRLIRSGIPLSTFGPDAGVRERVRRELGVPEGHYVVGSVGRLSAQKNPHDFVRVGADVLARLPNGLFVYVGDGPMREEIAAAAESGGVGDRLIMLGLRDDVADLLRAFDIFILTSLWEGLPRVVLQALATGVPVVAYDTAGIAEAVSEGTNGYLVPQGASGEMADRVAELLGDAFALRSMSVAAGDGFDRSFSEEKMLEDLEALYDELLLPAAPSA